MKQGIKEINFQKVNNQIFEQVIYENSTYFA